LQTKLLTPFYKDSTYYISFYVNRANKTSSAISNIEAYITTKKIHNQKLQINLNFIEFKNNEYIIKNKSDKKYSSIIKLLKKYSFTNISISGYTNSIGNKKLNNKLAKNRAIEVKKTIDC